MLNRDYFFEFAGMPQSGKSIIVDNVAHYFRSSGVRIGEYRGGSRYSTLHNAPIGGLNLSLACKAAEFITSTRHEKRDHKIYLLDRGVIDRCIFTNTLFHRQIIDEDEARRITNFLTLPKLLNTLDGVFIFITTPEMALDREHKSKIEMSTKVIKSPREVMNYSFLFDLQKASNEMYENIKEFISNIQYFDTAKEDGEIEKIASKVISNIESKIKL